MIFQSPKSIELVFKVPYHPKHTMISIATHDLCLLHTFVLMASTFDLNFLLFFPLQPALNSGPRVVSAVKECFVPLLDSNTNPGNSSFRIVACCKINANQYNNYKTIKRVLQIQSGNNIQISQKLSLYHVVLIY